MENLDKLLMQKPEKWIGTLPQYQINRIDQLISQGNSLEEVASLWLAASPKNISPFGTTNNQKLFLKKLEEELEALLCGDEKYNNDRAKLLSESNVTHAYVIGVISAAIGPVVGAAGPFLAPVIAILLMSLGRVSINAWCETCKAKKASNELSLPHNDL